MYFGFTLESSDIDLWNIDLLDAHLNLLDMDIPSKHFVCLQDMSSRRLEEVVSVTIFCVPIRLQDVLKDVFMTPSRRPRDVFKTFSRRLGRRKIIMLKTCWRRFQDMLYRLFQDMAWRGLHEILKTNKYLLVSSSSNSAKFNLEINSVFCFTVDMFWFFNGLHITGTTKASRKLYFSSN